MRHLAAALVLRAMLGASAAPGAVCIDNVASLACQEQLASAAITWRERAMKCDLERQAASEAVTGEPTWKVVLYVVGVGVLAGLGGYAVGRLAAK